MSQKYTVKSRIQGFFIIYNETDSHLSTDLNRASHVYELVHSQISDYGIVFRNPFSDNEIYIQPIAKYRVETWQYCTLRAIAKVRRVSVYCNNVVNHLLGRNQIAICLPTTFSVTFLCISRDFKWTITGSDNGLVPNMRRAIIWRNDALAYWRLYATLDLGELNFLAPAEPLD